MAEFGDERSQGVGRRLARGASLAGVAGPPRQLGRWEAVALALLISTAAGSCLATERSRILRAEFQRANPCPSTGKTRGACPGWQGDHREALICGGRDELQNLQWLTVEEHRAKTRVEVKLCRPRVRSRP